MYTQAFIDGLLTAGAPLVGWTFAVIMTSILLKRRGGKAEKLLLTGASIKLFRALAQIHSPALSIWLTTEKGFTSTQAAQVVSIFDFAGECVGLAGIIVLVCAFWIKFLSQEKSLNPSS